MKLILTFLLLGFVAQAQSLNDMHVLYANGTATETVEPNMIVVSVESWARSATAVQAQQQQSIQYGKIKSTVEKFKIKNEDFQTQGYSVTPEYVYDQKTQTTKIKGYRVSHSLVLIYRKIDDAGAFLDSMVTSQNDSSGINVQTVSWDYDKKEELERKALAVAIKNARAKADDMAKAAGVEIRAVHKIQQSAGYSPLHRPMLAMAEMKMSADSAAPPTEVASGQIQIKANVSIEFEIQ